jgi:enamine deaminase RidA (YjgF/YER057c/UK114 family)
MNRRALNPKTLAQPPGYSQVVEVTGESLVFIAGQVSWGEDGRIVGQGDFEAQARQVFNNLVRALDAVGATPADLAKLGIYVVEHDVEKLAIVRRVRDEILGVDEPPASTLIGVERLALPDLMIEVDAVAVVGPDPRGHQSHNPK